MSAVRDRLSVLGIVLPSVAVPAGVYVPAVRAGQFVYTSGQLPMVDGVLPARGKLGAEIETAAAHGLARICALNALAAIDALVGLDAVVAIVKVVGFVASAPGFNAQPAVINGASELLAEVFDGLLATGGAHARSAVGVAELPANSPVEVEMIVLIKE
ncbi:MAG: RutC family protein [Pseudonocardiales bacterium]|nr:RutC family protein [Pseudonocardiales bacterium]